MLTLSSGCPQAQRFFDSFRTVQFSKLLGEGDEESIDEGVELILDGSDQVRARRNASFPLPFLVCLRLLKLHEGVSDQFFAKFIAAIPDAPGADHTCKAGMISISDGLLTFLNPWSMRQALVDVAGMLTNFSTVQARGPPRLTAAIPMDNPYCSCKLTRVRSRCSGASPG